MISFLNAFTNIYALSINFIAHSLIFIGAFYVALHNRRLPQWHITPLWYMGLFSLLISITIILQWAIGPEFPLSYWNAGIMVETLSNISVAIVAVIMLVGTVMSDIKHRKKRQIQSE